ncbi:MAG: hypothetical protein F7C81_04605 [Desulfurococcales archaeon]|nr:hypothetical protein [Desulfurococcales archaeon]
MEDSPIVIAHSAPSLLEHERDRRQGLLGGLYLGEADPLTNTVVKTVLDRTTRTITRVHVTSQLPSNFEPVDIIGDLVASRISGRILGRKLGDKLL